MAAPIMVDSMPSTNKLAKKDYEKMGYDQDNTLTILEEIKQLSDKIQGDVDTITKNFNTLQGKYDEFTDFNEHMNKASNNLQASSEKISGCVTQVMQVLSENLTKLVEQDDSLKDDIEALNSLLANGELPETFGY